LLSQILKLITEKGARARYVKEARRSGVRLLRLLIATAAETTTSFGADPRLVRNLRRLRELKDRSLSAVSQVEFDTLRYALERANESLPPNHRDTQTQMQSHMLSLVRRLGDPIFETYLENQIKERQLRDGEYDKTILAITTALVKHAAREESLVEAVRSRAGSDADRRALTARPDPRKSGLNPTPRKATSGPCPQCGKPHPFSECFQNSSADARTLELAGRIAPSSPAGKAYREQNSKAAQRRNGGEPSAVAMRASGQGVAFIDSIAETLGPLDLEPSSSESLRPRALCASATSRRLGVGGAPTATAEGADAIDIDSCVYGLTLENYPTDEPQLPAPRSLRTTGPMGVDNMAPGRVLSLTIDSGASFHIVNDPTILINKRPSNETISGVDQREHRCTHIGDLPIAAQDEAGTAHHLTIHNVRCVPSISDSLLSILKLWDDEKFDCLFREMCAPFAHLVASPSPFSGSTAVPASAFGQSKFNPISSSRNSRRPSSHPNGATPRPSWGNALRPSAPTPRQTGRS
jgi:hypothetical protein